MKNKKDILKEIQKVKKMLGKYSEDLKNNPESLFYNGLVKNSKEYLEELYEELNKLNKK